MDRLLLDLLFDFAIVSGLSVAVLAVAVFAMPWAAILWDLNLNSKSDDLAAVAVEEGMIDLFISAAVTVEQYGKVKWNKNLLKRYFFPASPTLCLLFYVFYV